MTNNHITCRACNHDILPIEWDMGFRVVYMITCQNPSCKLFAFTFTSTNYATMDLAPYGIDPAVSEMVNYIEQTIIRAAADYQPILEQFHAAMHGKSGDALLKVLSNWRRRIPARAGRG